MPKLCAALAFWFLGSTLLCFYGTEARLLGGKGLRQGSWSPSLLRSPQSLPSNDAYAVSSPKPQAESLSQIEIPRSIWERLEWVIPIVAGAGAFSSFSKVSLAFHNAVLWASSNTWLPETKDDINLQANVVTQVINGPVITSISVLFGTLVSVTFATLHTRQFDVQKSFIIEVQTLRQLQLLLRTNEVKNVLDQETRTWAIERLQQHMEQSFDKVQVSRETNPHIFIESNLMTLLNGCNDLLLRGKQQDKSVVVLEAIRDLTLKLIKQRTNRWLALEALKFPVVHYLTLSLLAFGIGVSFLVATDEAEFIFLHGLPVKILWTILISSFAALAVVLNDLARPFGGAYRVTSRNFR